MRTAEDTNRMLRRIRALFRLAGGSPSQAEAASAVRRAQELMVAHGIDERDVAEHAGDYADAEVARVWRTGAEIRWVSYVLATCFSVCLLEGKFSRRQKKRLSIWGLRTDVAVAEHVYVFLVRAFRSEWKRVSAIAGTGDKEAFMAGMAVAIVEQCQHHPSEVEPERNAIVQSDQRTILDSLAARRPDVRKCRKRKSPTPRNPVFYCAGEKAGRRTQVRTAITGKGEIACSR